MKIHKSIIFCIIASLALWQSSCVGPIVKRPDGSIVVGGIVGTDSDALVVDGPLPELLGFAPITNKKGEIVGQRPIYGGGSGKEKALFASYGMNQSNGIKTIAAEIRNLGIAQGLKELAETQDANDAATAAKEIDAKAATDKAKLANEAARDAQAHAEKMAEITIPTTP